jgi:RimJ/RimL family protein N-acetyltransferase
MNAPRLRKAHKIRGKSIVLRNASSADAAFVLTLRSDARAIQHLSRTSPALLDQIDWLERYAMRSTEAYFIVESAAGDPLGTVRLYDAQQDSFCWGSWIMVSDAPRAAAIESALLVYAYALETLGFTKAHFKVRRDNERVWAFHERFGAERVREHDSEVDYVISNAAIKASMERYARFLPDRILVEPQSDPLPRP